MTAIVILNVIGAILIVTAIVSLLGWAVVRERPAQRANFGARRRTVRPKQPRLALTPQPRG
jgi:hypothetical protein